MHEKSFANGGGQSIANSPQPNRRKDFELALVRETQNTFWDMV